MVHLTAPRSTPVEPVVLAFHGTRHPDGEATVRRIAADASALLGGSDVRVGWVDIHPELLADQLPGLGACTVVPCFLAAGYHVRHDVPAAVDASPHPVRVTDHLGARALDAVAARVNQAGGPGDAMVLAAIGSRFAAAQAEVADAAAALGLRLGVDVRPGFIFGGEPRVADVVTALRAEGRRDILIAPYAIAPGLFAERLAGLGARVAAPLGAHPTLVAALARLVNSSLDRRVSPGKLPD
ncbi:MAG: sirohydrochlorin chelatase [Propioniciclava sp.]